MRDFVKLLDEVSYGHMRHHVFRDWCEMAACSISNTCDLGQHDEREQAYMRLVDKYKPEDVTRLSNMLGVVALALEQEYQDALGQTFMDLDFGNHWGGQYFTPWNVARAMAEMMMSDAKELVEQKPFITLMEPSCGSGVMVIAAADVLKRGGVNYQEKLHATCIDIDITAVHMAYIQLSLFGVPAMIIHGNALSRETWSTWYTPAHVIGLWSVKLREAQPELLPLPQLPPPPQREAPALPMGQLSLFGAAEGRK